MPRSEHRHGDHRQNDRHRLTGESAVAVHEGRSHPVEVINVSGGGAMICADFRPMMWDRLELRLGEGPGIEAAVRWLRDDRIGLEFAHETQIDCNPDVRNQLLLEVIRRSFPDIEAYDDDELEADVQDEGQRTSPRHPLIWTAEIEVGQDSFPARLRNVSVGGALVECEHGCSDGAEVMLIVSDSVQLAATVAWTCGDQAGLRFDEPFDLSRLATARPQIAPRRWLRPAYLQPRDADDSPWHHRWERRSVSDLRSSLDKSG